MRRQPPRKSLMSDDRILPLINVVFMLLIFFMLAGRFSATDPFEIEPARSASEAPGQLEPLVVLIGADGRIGIGNEVVTRDALAREVGSRAGNGPATIRLKADGRADASQVIAVMELIRDAGGDKLKLLTLARQP